MSPARGATLGLVLALGAGLPEAEARCREPIALLPVSRVAAARGEVSAAEKSLRDALEGIAPGCTQERAETLGRLRAHGGMPACVEDGCRIAWLGKLGVKWIVKSGALAVGGERSVTLSLWGEKGESGRRLVTGETPPALPQAVRELWTTRSPRPGEPPRLGLLPHISLGAGVAILGAGLTVGLLANRTQAAVSTGTAGCPPETFSSCFEQKVAVGRSQAFWANALFATGAAVAGTSAVLLVWTLP